MHISGNGGWKENIGKSHNRAKAMKIMASLGSEEDRTTHKQTLWVKENIHL